MEIGPLGVVVAAGLGLAVHHLVRDEAGDAEVSGLACVPGEVIDRRVVAPAARLRAGAQARRAGTGAVAAEPPCCHMTQKRRFVSHQNREDIV